MPGNPQEELRRILYAGSLGVMSCVFFALVWLKPEAAPHELIKALLLFASLMLAITIAITISDLVDKLRERRER